MGEVINLRSIRKQRARAEKEQEAANNRAKFGRSKSERDAVDAEVKRSDALLDGHKRDGEDT